MTTPPPVDLILIFRTSPSSRSEAQQAQQQYTALLSALRAAGLDAIGKPGSAPSELLVFVRCPWPKMQQLAEQSRTADFLHGVSSASLPALEQPVTEAPLTPADRLRFLHSYITSAPSDGGLGIAPGAKNWSRLTGVMVLKDRAFEHAWITSWTTRRLGVWMGDAELSRLKDVYGESVALYFAFLSSYTHALVVPALLGLLFWALGLAYSPLYAVPLLLWAITFVELFRLRERTLAVRWGTRNAERVERRRAEFSGTISEDGVESFPWWMRELRVLASIPVILLETLGLGAILTAIFVFEAFVTQIYTGPGAAYAGYIPTLIFLTFIPRLLGWYQSTAKALTDWENHAHQSTYARSLTLKTFALSATVAYLGLYLTAFVYVPFGSSVMHFVYTRVLSLRLPASSPSSASEAVASAGAALNGTTAGPKLSHSFASLSDAQGKIRPNRLHNQMFAYTVTNQVISFAMEVLLPYITRAAGNVQQGKGLSGKRGLVLPEEQGMPVGSKTLLERAREEAALPDYELFGDYAEMVTQFGYVVLWSVAWPLAPVCALANNWVELRSDAFKIVTHVRRPVPQRTDSIGPWLDSLAFIVWLGAVTNAALVFLFEPGQEHGLGSQSTLSTTLSRTRLSADQQTLITALLPALLVALASSHAYILARWLVRHVLERALWVGSAADVATRKRDREVRGLWMGRAVASAGGENVGGVGRELGVGVPGEGEKVAGKEEGEWKVFWEEDEGMEEIQKVIKTA